MRGTFDEITTAVKSLEKVWELGSVVCSPDEFRMNGVVVNQGLDHQASVNMEERLQELKLAPLTRSRRRELTDEPTNAEFKGYQSIAGKLGWLGTRLSPFATFAASRLQRREIDMNASDLANGDHMANAILKRIPMIKCTPTKESDICILAFAGAGLPC